MHQIKGRVLRRGRITHESPLWRPPSARWWPLSEQGQRITAELRSQTGKELRITASDLWKPLILLFQMEIVIWSSSNRHLWWWTLTILRGSPSLGYNFHQLSQLPLKVKVLAAQLCLTLCNSMDCSLPGSSVHGIFQARILEWVAMPSSKGSSHPRGRTHISYVSCISRQFLYH